MTSRERILTALDHREPDRIPVDLSGHRSSGIAAMAYDPIGQGERFQLLDEAGKPRFKSTEEHTLLGATSMLVGRGTATYRIWDGMRALDYLCSRPEIDAKRIGMTGTTHRVNFPPPGLPWDHPIDAVASTTARDQGLLLDRMVKGAADATEAAALGATPELCGLALDILSWQRLRNLIPSLLPQKAKVANKTGRGPRGRMGA